MSCTSGDAPTARRPNTAAAFLFAPGIASLAGALVLAGALPLDPATSPSAKLASALGVTVFMSMAFAVVGYLTAAVVAVPVYLVLPERARGCFAVVVPLAGAIAAAPWLLIVAPWNGGRAEPWLLAVPFALGAVAGIAFLFLHRVPDPEDEALP